MMRSFHPFVALTLLCVIAISPARADTLLQTATLGPTGHDVLGNHVIQHGQYIGARFQTNQTYNLTDVQIHALTLSTAGNSLLFAAIVPVASLSEFPSDLLIANSNPVEFHTFTAPVGSSALITIPFSATLPAGFFAVVFGGGEFGATGVGAATMNNTDIGTPSYFIENTAYFNVGPPNISNLFFAVHGTQIGAAAPEPASLALLALAGLPVVGLVVRRRK